MRSLKERNVQKGKERGAQPWNWVMKKILNIHVVQDYTNWVMKKILNIPVVQDYTNWVMKKILYIRVVQDYPIWLVKKSQIST